MVTLYAVERYTPGYDRRIVAVYAYKDEASKFADYENLAHDYSSFSVKEVTPSSITGITCVIDGQTFMIRGMRI